MFHKNVHHTTPSTSFKSEKHNLKILVECQS